MSLAATLTRAGFDLARLRFAAPTAVAACLALALAAVLGLEHPQWAAMTVWAASQPSRGQLLEKSFWRFAGTVSGTLAGVFLVSASIDRPWLLVAGLSAWIGACAGIGNIQRGFVSYGTMLAGYSAAMVALLDAAHPEHVVLLGADRLATVLTGVGVALVVGLIVAPAGREQPIVARVDAIAAEFLRALAARVHPAHDRRVAAAARALSVIAEIDEGLDPHGAGSLRSRRLVRAVRGRLVALVAGLLWLHAPSVEVLPDDLAEALDAAAGRLEDPARPAGRDADLDRALDRALGLAAGRPRLLEILGPLFAALSDRPDPDDAGGRSASAGPLVVLHRDWVGAREASVRSVATMVLVGTFWLTTGWSGGPFLLLGTAIMTSLFSTFDNPAQFMRNVFFGQVLGALGALACRWFVWPLVDGEIGRIVTLMPFVLLGVAVFAHRRTQLAGFDYNMVVLLLSQPIDPPSGTVLHSLAVAAAVASAPIAGWFAYRLVYPVGPRRRLETLVAGMVHDLRAMARSTRRPVDRAVWRSRLYHRLLRSIRWAEKAGGRPLSISEGGLAVLDLGSAILRMRDIAAEPGLAPSVGRVLRVALDRVAGIDEAPDRLARTIRTAAARLDRADRAEDAARLRLAASGLLDHRAFFALARSRSETGEGVPVAA